MATLKSVKAFFDSDGTKCPHCGDDDISGDSLDVEGTRIYQHCSCGSCDKEFTIAATVDTIMAGAYQYECSDISGNAQITRFKN